MKLYAAPLFAALLGCALLPVLAAEPPGAPRFTAENELIRPEGYREWVLAGSSLAMSYSDPDEKPSSEEFHHVYISPAAYGEYQRSGRFPEGTVLMLEILSAGSRASINRQGRFADRFLRVEAAVKDSSRFPERWAYFGFGGPEGAVKPTAKAFEKERCWSCHNEHAAVDNVFTQFYPALRRAP